MLNEERKRKSIGQKTIIGIIVFTLLLTIAVSLPVSISFSVISRDHYYEDTRDFAGIISHAIDGDVIAGYVETGKKDGYYNTTETFLTSLCDEVELTDISIYAPAGSGDSKKLFGEERLALALNKNSGADPEELLKNVKEAIDGFVGDAPQFDDITMLAFRYNGKRVQI